MVSRTSLAYTVLSVFIGLGVMMFLYSTFDTGFAAMNSTAAYSGGSDRAIRSRGMMRDAWVIGLPTAVMLSAGVTLVLRSRGGR